MAVPNALTDGSYDATSPASQGQGTLAQLQILAKTHPEILNDPGIQAALSDPAKLQTALQAWQHAHGMDPSNVYDASGTLQNKDWVDNHGALLMALGAGVWVLRRHRARTQEVEID